MERDPDKLAFEKEQMKGPLGGPLRKRFEDDNLAILENFDIMVDRVDAIGHDAASRGMWS